MTLRTKILISIFLVALGASCRLLPHFWNFAPVTAIALFSGAYLGKRWGIAVPLSAMLIGDLFIGFYELPLMIVVYTCFALFGLGGSLLGISKSAKTVLGASLISSITFFVATNWAVWQFSPWYIKNFSGLMECYLAALPFYRNTLLGDIFYTVVLFGAYEAVKIWVNKEKLSLAFQVKK